MKRIFSLLALLALFATAAWLTQDLWQPLFKSLSNEQTSNRLQGFEAILSIAALIAAGVAAFLKFRPGSPSPEPVPTAQRESTAWQEQDPAYEPTPVLDGAPTLDKGESPYVGLSAFRKEDAHLFFGRHREAREALAWLGTPIPGDGTNGEARYRWLQIEGNSGAGKSSLVNAGMLPLIDQGALEARTGFSRWCTIGPMMPGEQPLRRLAEVLEQALVADAQKRDTLARQKRLESD